MGTKPFGEVIKDYVESLTLKAAEINDAKLYAALLHDCTITADEAADLKRALAHKQCSLENKTSPTPYYRSWQDTLASMSRAVEKQHPSE